MTGTTLRSTYPVNTDKFRVYYQKKFRIAPGTLATGTREYDFFKWGYTFKSSRMPASLTWDEGTGDDANNFAPFLVIGYSYTDGTAPDVGHPTDQQHLRRIPLRRRVNPQQNWRESPGLRTKVQTPKSPDPRSVQPARTLRKPPFSAQKRSVQGYNTGSDRVQDPLVLRNPGEQPLAPPAMRRSCV